MKLIRWWGIAVFVVIVVLGIALTKWLAPNIIRSSIEEIGSEANGAMVDVSAVNLDLFPLKIAIKGVQVTDSNQPMNNIIEIDEVAFGLDAGALLWKKVVIDELVMTGLQMNTERTSSGKLRSGRRTEQIAETIDDLALPELSEADLKKLVNESDLLTIQRLRALETKKSELDEYWKQALDQKALKERMAKIKQEYERLKQRAKENKLNILGDRKKWKALKASVDSERKKLASLKARFDKDKKDLSKMIADVRNGPKDDLKAISTQLGVANGVDGLLDKYLGPELTPWIKKAFEMTKGMQPNQTDSSEEQAPIYETAKGKRVQFKDEQIFPDVLIKKITLSGQQDKRKIAGLGKQIGYFPWLTGQPAHLNIDVSGDGQLRFAATSDWQSDSKMKTNLDAKVNAWPVKNLSLMQTEKGNWLVSQGELNATLAGQVTLDSVNLDMQMSLKQPKVVSPENVSGWQKNLASALNNQANITIGLKVSGSIGDPQYKISSSLEKLFASAIGEKVKQKAAQYQGKLKSAITDKVGDLSQLEGMLGSFDQWGKQLTGNDKLLENFRP